MILLIEKESRRALVVLIVRYEQIAGITNKNPFRVQRMVLLKDSYDLAIEPALQYLRIGIPRQLTQIVLVARGLAIVFILLVKPRTAQGNVAGLRMGGLVAHGRAKSLDHAAAAH